MVNKTVPFLRDLNQIVKFDVESVKVLFQLQVHRCA